MAFQKWRTGSTVHHESSSDIKRRELDSTGIYSPNIDAFSVYKSLHPFSCSMNIFGFQLGNRFKKGRTASELKYLKGLLKMWIWMILLRLNISKGIVTFFLYQNWLDPSKEIEKQIRGKCSRHTPAHAHTHTLTHTHCPTNPHTCSILLNRHSFAK